MPQKSGYYTLILAVMSLTWLHPSQAVDPGVEASNAAVTASTHKFVEERFKSVLLEYNMPLYTTMGFNMNGGYHEINTEKLYSYGTGIFLRPQRDGVMGFSYEKFTPKGRNLLNTIEMQSYNLNLGLYHNSYDLTFLRSRIDHQLQQEKNRNVGLFIADYYLDPHSTLTIGNGSLDINGLRFVMLSLQPKSLESRYRITLTYAKNKDRELMGVGITYYLRPARSLIQRQREDFNHVSLRALPFSEYFD